MKACPTWPRLAHDCILYEDRRYNDTCGNPAFHTSHLVTTRRTTRRPCTLYFSILALGNFMIKKSSNRTRNRIMLYIHLTLEGFKMLLDSPGQPLDTIKTTRLSSIDRSSSKRTVILLGRVDARRRSIGISAHTSQWRTTPSVFARLAVFDTANWNLCDSFPRHSFPVAWSSSHDNQGSRPPTPFTHLAFAAFSSRSI